MLSIPIAVGTGTWGIAAVISKYLSLRLLIIAHAITERLPLLSSDEKFPFYRAQGLDLIEY